MAPNIQLVVIDPENDFCNPNGSLFVPGSEEDMDRLALMINRLKGTINDIHVTLDAHHPVDIAHSVWFVDDNGNHPAPFTQISSLDLKDKVWMTTNESAQDRTMKYLWHLEARGRYTHTIWPNHCLIGTEGTNVVPNIADALMDWTSSFNWVNFITKGSNPWTEHFSAVQAEVPDVDDDSTLVNVDFVERLEEADIILVAGEAGSHCVANTCMDLAEEFLYEKYAEKLHLLTDAISPVSGFESLHDDFIKHMTRLGMKLTTTTTDFVKSC